MRYPATASSVVLFCVLAFGFWSVGALSPDELPSFAKSSRQVIGMTLMLILLPPYFVAAGIVIRRQSLALVEQLRPCLPSSAAGEEASTAIRDAWKSKWLAGTFLGLVMGLFNAPLENAFSARSAPEIYISIALGQMILWWAIGMMIVIRFEAARAFHRLGAVVEFDLFQLDRLKPLSRSGLLDVLVIAGALALSPLQSLDAEFRGENYAFAILIATITSFLFVIWPQRSIHRRIQREKQARLDAIDRQLGPAAKGGTGGGTEVDVGRLESLLAHRDRVRNLRTWLVSTDLVSRVLLYLVIPPLAWVAAAVVENWVDRLISG